MAAPVPDSERTSVPKMGCGYAVCAVLALAGIALLFVSDRRSTERRLTDAWVSGIAGGALCLASVGLIGPMKREVARAAARRKREDSAPDKPWTWDDAWTRRGGILQVHRRHGRALTVFGWFALVVSSPGVYFLREEIANGNHAAWLILLFPLLGVWLLGLAGRDAWRRRKYGVARLVLDRMPVPLGGELTGMVMVDRRLEPSGAGRVTLECWSTTVGEGGSRSQREQIVVNREREIARDEWSCSARESRLFVQLPVDGLQPTTMTRLAKDTPTIEWRLRVATPTPGADFVADFVLPVFDVPVPPGERPAPRGVEAPADRAAIWRAAEIRAEPIGGVRGATKLVLPAGQGRALVTMPLVLTLLFAGLAGVLWWSPAPGFLAFFFGVFAAVPALVLPALLFGGGEEVWAENGAVYTRRGAKLPRQIAFADVLELELVKNVGVGTQQFYRIIARTNPRRPGLLPRRFEIASMVRGEDAAQHVVAWLEERMTKTASGRYGFATDIRSS